MTTRSVILALMKKNVLNFFWKLALAFSIAGCSLDDSHSEDLPEIGPFQCASRDFSVDNPPSRVAVLGNSLLMGNGSFGVCASDSTKDYFFRLDSAFRKANPKCVSRRIMAKNLELMDNSEDFENGLKEILAPQLSKNLDLVIVQLGDNIDGDEAYEWIVYFVEGVLGTIHKHAPRAKVAWVGEWYSSDKKQYALREATQAHNVQFIDISSIKSDSTEGDVGDIIAYPEQRVQSIPYKSFSVEGDSLLTVVFEEGGEKYEATVPMDSYHDYPEESRLDLVGHQGVVIDAMMASHPNDYGFKLIAEKILEELGF